MKPFEKLATSIKGMVAMYEVSQATVERAIKSGELPVARKGRRIIIRISDAERWIGKSK
jgi:helix-turn-helix protein